MNCPLVFNYRGTPFDPFKRPGVVAALLSAGKGGVIQPADGERWFSRDMNEMVNRQWAAQHRLRQDQLWFYRLRPEGLIQAQLLSEAGWLFDGYDVWFKEELVR